VGGGLSPGGRSPARAGPPRTWPAAPLPPARTSERRVRWAPPSPFAVWFAGRAAPESRPPGKFQEPTHPAGLNQGPSGRGPGKSCIAAAMVAILPPRTVFRSAGLLTGFYTWPETSPVLVSGGKRREAISTRAPHTCLCADLCTPFRLRSSRRPKPSPPIPRPAIPRPQRPP